MDQPLSWEPLWLPGAVLGWAPVAASQGRLPPEERAAVAGACGKRRREFIAGRTLARRLLCSLGIPPAPIPVGPRGAPLWPRGVVGSLSHSSGFCAAVVGPSRCYRSLGVDCEAVYRFRPQVAQWIVRRGGSAQRISSRPGDHRDLAAAIFTAREAAYKALAPLGWRGGLFEIELELDGAAMEFRARGGGEQAHGGFLHSHGMVIASCGVRR